MIRAAEPRDRASVESLLLEASLPIDGVEEHLASFFVVDDGGKIVGVAGIEAYGKDALLRSVVVAKDARGTGIGLLLTQRALDAARAHRRTYRLSADGDGRGVLSSFWFPKDDARRSAGRRPRIA